MDYSITIEGHDASFKIDLQNSLLHFPRLAHAGRGFLMLIFMVDSSPQIQYNRAIANIRKVEKNDPIKCCSQLGIGAFRPAPS